MARPHFVSATPPTPPMATAFGQKDPAALVKNATSLSYCSRLQAQTAVVAASPLFGSSVPSWVQGPPLTREEVGSTGAEMNREVTLVATQDTKLESANGNHEGESDNRKYCSPANNTTPPGVWESGRELFGTGGDSGKIDGSSSKVSHSEGDVLDLSEVESSDSDEESGRYFGMTSQAADVYFAEGKKWRDLARGTNGNIKKKRKSETDKLNLSVSACRGKNQILPCFCCCHLDRNVQAYSH